jgi:hypothetical protein
MTACLGTWLADRALHRLHCCHHGHRPDRSFRDYGYGNVAYDGRSKTVALIKRLTAGNKGPTDALVSRDLGGDY